MYDNSECIICLTDTSDNDYIELDCCKKIVHIDCLNLWIQTNIKNTEEVRKCFHCKKKNDYINTIIHYTKLEEGNNTNYESDNNSLLIEINTNYSNTNNIILAFKNASKILCFIIITIIITNIILTEYYDIKILGK